MNLQAKRRDDREKKREEKKKKERLPEGRRIVEETVDFPQVRVFPVIAQRRAPAVEGVEPRRDATGAVQDVS